MGDRAQGEAGPNPADAARLSLTLHHILSMRHIRKLVFAEETGGPSLRAGEPGNSPTTDLRAPSAPLKDPDCDRREMQCLVSLSMKALPCFMAPTALFSPQGPRSPSTRTGAWKLDSSSGVLKPGEPKGMVFPSSPPHPRESYGPAGTQAQLHTLPSHPASRGEMTVHIWVFRLLQMCISYSLSSEFICMGLFHYDSIPPTGTEETIYCQGLLWIWGSRNEFSL